METRRGFTEGINRAFTLRQEILSIEKNFKSGQTANN